MSALFTTQNAQFVYMHYKQAHPTIEGRDYAKKLEGKMVGCFVGWLVDWLVGWLVG